MAQVTKEKIVKSDFVKTKIFFCIRRHYPPSTKAEWEKILASHTSDKGLIFIKYTELQKLNKSNNNTLI